MVCSELARSFAFSVDAHRISFTNRHPGLQLRCYLWHLFHLYQETFLNRCGAPPIDDWPWYPVIQCLLRDTRLTIVSYNYECLIETIVSDCFYSYFSPPVFCVEQASSRTAEEIVVLKPHGSISHTFPSYGGSEGGGLFVVNNCDGGWRFARNEIELHECPSFPDLVPPGHSQYHLANYETNVMQAVKHSFAEADFVLLCGFRAAGPDATELEAFLEACNPGTPAAHVGLRSADDESNSAGNLLRRFCAPYAFFDAAEVQSIPPWINASLST